MNPIINIENFIAIVETGSISAAAEKQQITPAASSKRLQQLEQSLGIRLLTRTTRSQAMTEAGAFYYRHQKQLLDEIERIEEHVQGMQQQLKGVLNINMPMTYGKIRLNALLIKFVEQNPDIRINCQLEDAFVDVNGGEFDLVVRIGELQDSELVARKLEAVKLMILASPEYLQRNGHPVHPRELKQHNCLHYTNLEQKDNWKFYDPDGSVYRIKTQGNFSSNNGETLKQAALQGLGIAQIPDFAAEPEVLNGQLIPLLTDYITLDLYSYAVYPSRRYLPEKTRALIDFLRENLNNERT